MGKNLGALNSITTFITHESPDLDALISLWLASKFAKHWDPNRVQLIPAGTAEPEDRQATVAYFDVGGGIFDHHETNERTSAADQLAKHLGMSQEPAYRVLVEASIKADHAESVETTDLRHLVNGYIFRYRGGKLDLVGLLERVFELFDILSEQQVARDRAAKEFDRVAEWPQLQDTDVRLCVLPGKPALRHEAFDRGADVAIWNQENGSVRYTGIAVNSRSDVRLKPLASLLRQAEIEVRKLARPAVELNYWGLDQAVEPSWFLHTSEKLILNGSKKRKLEESEVSRLDLNFIVWLAARAFAGQ